ncbi:Acetolactate synthase isozyme 1 large subunit [compost metagenome]
MDPARVIVALREGLDARAILTNGAGNYSAWAHRYYRFSHPRTQLAPTSGAMGYGVPAAIAAKLRHPERQVVCLAGDGCFLMTSQELATVKQHRLAIVFIVFNNGMYGTIRMHQEVNYPSWPTRNPSACPPSGWTATRTSRPPWRARWKAVRPT